MAKINMDFNEYAGVVGMEGYGAIITVKKNDLAEFNRLVG